MSKFEIVTNEGTVTVRARRLGDAVDFIKQDVNILRVQ